MGFLNYNYKHKYIQVQGRVGETLKRDGRPQRLMTQIRFSIIHSFCCTFKRVGKGAAAETGKGIIWKLEGESPL